MSTKNWKSLFVTVSRNGQLDVEKIFLESEVTVGCNADDTIRLPDELSGQLFDQRVVFSRDDNNGYTLSAGEAFADIVLKPYLYSHHRRFSDIAQDRHVSLKEGASGEITLDGNVKMLFRIDRPPDDQLMATLRVHGMRRE